MGRTVEGAEPSGWVEKKTRPSHLKRTWVGCSVLLGFVAMILFSVLHAGAVMGETVLSPIPDFSVETAQGKFTFSEHRGEILVYFFSFPG